MRFCTLPDLAAAALLAAGSLTAWASAPSGIGWVSGSASAVYLLEAPGAPRPPQISTDGFTQSVEGSPGRWTVGVTVAAGSLPVRQPFRPGPLPSSLPLPAELRGKLAGALSSCQRADEAVQAVALFLRTHLNYTERVSFEESPAEVLRRGEASCVGFAQTAAAILDGLGIRCKTVVGLKVPLRREPVRLEGGLLHAWVEVDFQDGATVFCDPLRSFGWVPESYVVLRVGGGLTPEALALYSGGRVTLKAHRDRIFFEPPQGMAAVLWARPSAALSTGSLLSGKLLGPLDLPAAGRAVLSGQGGEVSMPLWEGNYFFRDLEPGHYALTLLPQGEKPRTAAVPFRGMERRFVVSYAGADGDSGPGAMDEPRRKP